MLIPRLAAFAGTAALWLLWALCVLLIFPALLSPPGNPEPGDVELYVAVLGAVTIYPIALPVLMLLKRRARRKNNHKTLATLRIVIGLSSLAVLVILGMLFAGFYAHEQSRPVLTQEERFTNAYANAMLRDDTTWMDRLMAEGADVDHPMSLGQTPASMAADFGKWRVVLHLLERGADPDRRDDRADSVRTLAASPSELPKDPDEAQALTLVRERLGLSVP